MFNSALRFSLCCSSLYHSTASSKSPAVSPGCFWACWVTQRCCIAAWAATAIPPCPEAQQPQELMVSLYTNKAAQVGPRGGRLQSWHVIHLQALGAKISHRHFFFFLCFFFPWAVQALKVVPFTCQCLLRSVPSCNFCSVFSLQPVAFDIEPSSLLKQP